MVSGNKGQVNSIFIILVMVGLLAGIMLFFYIYALIVPFISKATNEVTDLTSSIAGTENSENANITETLTSATRPIYGINSFLVWFGYVFTICLLLAFLVIAYNVRNHPYLGVFWIFLVLLLAICAMWLSNSYEDIKNSDSYLTEAYESNVVNNFMMIYLPHIIVSFGLIGGLFLFVLVSKDPQMEGVYQ